MSDKPENPPAFACAATDGMGLSHLQEGMTLRDYFAGAALQGDAANSEGGPWGSSIDEDFLNRRCTFYYRLADSMLKARQS